MQFVGGHKFLTSAAGIYIFFCLCAVSPFAILCHKYISLAHKWLQSKEAARARDVGMCLQTVNATPLTGGLKGAKAKTVF